MLDGLLLVDKAPGMTSHDVVSCVRRIAGTKKVGHTGTLDPDATGLLPLTLGVCTKLAQYLILDVKDYDFTLKFGEETATDDASGEMTHECAWTHITKKALEDALKAFRGEIMQRPPNYSAIRVDGRRAYELAREGVKFTLPERPVVVHRLELLSLNLPHADLSLSCSSGTYVRGLVRDLGRALDSVAHTTSIRRMRVGDFCVADAKTLKQLEEEGVEDSLLTPAQMMSSVQVWVASAQEVDALVHGRMVQVEGDWSRGDAIAVLDEEGVLIAMTRAAQDPKKGAVLQPKRVLKSL